MIAGWIELIMSALALLSGGLDSLVASAHAARHGGLALAITYDYGQRASAREREAASTIAAELGAEHRVVPLPPLNRSSALIDRGRAIPSADAGGLEDPDLAAQVWVPNRNGLFIHAAACIAASEGLDEIIVGFNREEARTFPDNSPEFIEATNRALTFSLDAPVRVASPTTGLTKAQIVHLGVILAAPLHEVWSCYTEGPVHCMHCESCLRLKRALELEGIWEKIAPRLGLR